MAPVALMVPTLLSSSRSPGQIVISGDNAALEKAMELAKARGAKRVIRLQVSIASHSPLMIEAAEAMRAELGATAVSDPATPMLANADASLITTAAALRSELSNHLTTGVDWIAAVDAMVAVGTTRFVEVGAGRVLTGLVKRIPSAEGAELLSIDDLPTAAVVAA